MSTRQSVISALNTIEPTSRAGGSPYDKLHKIEEHLHSAGRSYPTLANGVTVTGGAGAWQQGALTEIVPANAITSEFDIHWVNIGDVSAADTYELHLFYGAADTFAGSVRFTRPAGAITNSFAPFISPLIPANSRVRAQLASSGGGADTAVVSVECHTY